MNGYGYGYGAAIRRALGAIGFLLQENGSRILLENGTDVLILE